MTEFEALRKVAKAARDLIDLPRLIKLEKWGCETYSVVYIQIESNIRDALAALDAAEPDGWQPIKEYLSDAEGWGPNVLLFVPTGCHAPASDYRILTGRLEAEMWLGWDDGGTMFDIGGTPTYFRSLPLPPAANGEGGDVE